MALRVRLYVDARVSWLILAEWPEYRDHVSHGKARVYVTSQHDPLIPKIVAAVPVSAVL